MTKIEIIEKLEDFYNVLDVERVEETLGNIIKEKPHLEEVVKMLGKIGINLESKDTTLDVFKKISKKRGEVTKMIKTLEEKEAKMERIVMAMGKMAIKDIVKKHKGFKVIIDEIKSNGIKISTNNKTSLIEVLNELNETIANKIIDKVSNETLDQIIKEMEEEKENNENNTLGGVTMNKEQKLNGAKVKGFKKMGLEGLYKMAAFNSGLMEDKEFLAAVSELQEETVNPVESAVKEEEKPTKVEKEGTMGTKTEEAKATTVKEEKVAEVKTEGTTVVAATEEGEAENTQGGQEMKEGTTATTTTNAATGIFGVKHQLQILNNKKYFDLLATVAEKLGAKGLEKIDETGTKLAVVAVKEAGTLKELIYRIATVAAVEWVKSQVDNDFVELIGSTIQGYQVLRIGGNIYKLYKTFDEVSRKDINDLEELLERLMAERDARRQQGKKVPNMAM